MSYVLLLAAETRAFPDCVSFKGREGFQNLCHLYDSLTKKEELSVQI